MTILGAIFEKLRLTREMSAVATKLALGAKHRGILKSAGKLGMAAVAGVTMTSIFSSCKKEPLIKPQEPQVDIDSTLVHQLDSLLHELDSIVHP